MLRGLLICFAAWHFQRASSLVLVGQGAGNGGKDPDSKAKGDGIHVTSHTQMDARLGDTALRDLRAQLNLPPTESESIALVAGNMTLQSAVSIMKSQNNASKEFTSLVDEMGQYISSGANFRGKFFSGSADDVDEAAKHLNGMILEANRRLDVEHTKCLEFDRKEKELISDTIREIAQANAENTGARLESLTAQSTLDESAIQLTHLSDHMKESNHQCEQFHHQVTDEVALTDEDLDAAMHLTFLSGCKDGDDDFSLPITLLECQHNKSNSRTFAFNQSVLQRTAARIRTDFGRRAMQMLLGASNSSDSKTLGLLVLDNDPSLEASDADKMAMAKCAPRDEVSCGVMQQRLLSVQMGISDRVTALKRSLVHHEQDCEEKVHQGNAMMHFTISRQQEAQAALTSAARLLTESSQQSQQKEGQLRLMKRENKETLTECESNIRGFEQEVCSAFKLRVDLYRMAKRDVEARDCQVSEWTPAPCSVVCGGGLQTLTRKITSPPNAFGAQCRPLTMQRQCNIQACPTDCELDDWGGWGSCTAQCGGGVKQRNRKINTPPDHGGKPCEQTSDSISCNVQACNRDCTLAEWTEWSSCSKECHGGVEIRHKHVLEKRLGTGHCWDEFHSERVQYQPCNTQECRVAPNTTLTCKSKLDVIVILDGSAGLRENGWEAAKTAAQKLVMALQGGEDRVQVAVLVFSGPKSWETMKTCYMTPVLNLTESEFIGTCGLNWVTRFTTDTQSAAQKISGVEWPKATKMTSAALMEAVVELNAGRQNTQSVVVVITTGAPPLSPMASNHASELVKEKSRLLFVTVDAHESMDHLKTWVSPPANQNIIQIEDFEHLSSNHTVSHIIADICPIVEEAPQEATRLQAYSLH